MTIKELMQYMRKEIERGIDDTGIKPGHLKIAISDLTRQQERVIKAYEPGDSSLPNPVSRVLLFRFYPVSTS